MRQVLRISTVVVGVLMSTGPAFGGPKSTRDDSAGIALQASIERAAAQSPLQQIVRQQQPQNDAGGEPKAFFKSPKGIAILAVLSAGFGYAIYSKVHDRVHTRNPDR